MGMLWKYEHTWPSGPDHDARGYMLPQLQRVACHVETLAHGIQRTCEHSVGEPDHLRHSLLSQDSGITGQKPRRPPSQTHEFAIRSVRPRIISDLYGIYAGRKSMPGDQDHRSGVILPAVLLSQTSTTGCRLPTLF